MPMTILLPQGYSFSIFSDDQGAGVRACQVILCLCGAIWMFAVTCRTPNHKKLQQHRAELERRYRRGKLKFSTAAEEYWRLRGIWLDEQIEKGVADDATKKATAVQYDLMLEGNKEMRDALDRMTMAMVL